MIYSVIIYLLYTDIINRENSNDVFFSLIYDWKKEFLKHNTDRIPHLNYLLEKYTPFRGYKEGDLPSSTLLKAMKMVPPIKMIPNRSVFGIAVNKGKVELEWYLYHPCKTVLSLLCSQHPLAASIPIPRKDIGLISFTDYDSIDLYTTDLSCGHGVPHLGRSSYGYLICMTCKYAAKSYRWDGVKLVARNKYYTFLPEDPIEWINEIPLYLREFTDKRWFSTKPNGCIGYYVSHITTRALIIFLEDMRMPKELLEFIRKNEKHLDHLKWEVGWNKNTDGKIYKTATYGIF
jgi:hypothetical protein